jgi:beta-carotene 3-hydroxylase
LLRKIAAGHTIHHTEAFEGVPWGLFLGIQELEAVPGGLDELNKVVAAAERKEQRDEQDNRASVGLVTQGTHIPSQKEAPACVLPDVADKGAGPR